MFAKGRLFGETEMLQMGKSVPPETAAERKGILARPTDRDTILWQPHGPVRKGILARPTDRDTILWQSHGPAYLLGLEQSA
jgi:hypothetical protein